jgi:hypothetical protein
MAIMEDISQIRVSSTSVDEYGQPVTVETVTVIKAIVSARVSGTNYDPDQIVLVQGITLYLPAGSTVFDDDKFIVRGKRYEIDGEAFDWRSGLGSWNPGVVVNLQREKNVG